MSRLWPTFGVKNAPGTLLQRDKLSPDWLEMTQYALLGRFYTE